MKSVLVEARDAFKVSSGNIIVDSFAKNRLLPLSPPNMITNTQAMAASVQTSSKGINCIAEDTVAPIQLQVTRTNEPMVIIRAKGSNQQPPRNILLRAAVYDIVRKRTVLPLQEMKRENKIIHQQKKVELADEDANTRSNPNSTSGIYLTADKAHNVDKWLRIGEKWMRRKRSQQRRQPQEIFFSNSRGLKLFICASTQRTVYLRLPRMKIG